MAKKHKPPRSYLWLWWLSGGVIGLCVGAVGGAMGGARAGVALGETYLWKDTSGPYGLVIGLMIGLVVGLVIGAMTGALAGGGLAALIGGWIETLRRKRKR